MEKNINYNTIIVNLIERKLPPDKKTYKYLMDTLLLGKEPAYRRIRGEVLFPFEEVIKISQNLGVSIDHIVQQGYPNSNVVQFDMPEKLISNIDILFFDFLCDSCEIIKRLISAKSSKINIAMNRIPWSYMQMPNLLKLEYFRYLHAANIIKINTYFQDIIIPPNIIEQQQNLSLLMHQVPYVNCIFDKNIINKTIEEIIFFYEENYLNKDDVQMLQKDLLNFIDLLYVLNKIGKNNIGAKRDFYFSELSIDTNVLHYESEDETMEQYWIYLENPIIIKNSPIMSSLNKRWYNSRKRHSILITNSNEKFLTTKYWDIKRSINKLEDLLL
ncbi:MAG: hypothetical protein LBV69_06265 [Bacteroidales bacterium]|jgi:hypothetical protein|nr:hypothetical protein [Bacteroidales bacterium]